MPPLTRQHKSNATSADRYSRVPVSLVGKKSKSVQRQAVDVSAGLEVTGQLFSAPSRHDTQRLARILEMLPESLSKSVPEFAHGAKLSPHEAGHDGISGVLSGHRNSQVINLIGDGINMDKRQSGRVVVQRVSRQSHSREDGSTPEHPV